MRVGRIHLLLVSPTERKLHKNRDNFLLIDILYDCKRIPHGIQIRRFDFSYMSHMPVCACEYVAIGILFHPNVLQASFLVRMLVKCWFYMHAKLRIFVLIVCSDSFSEQHMKEEISKNRMKYLIRSGSANACLL